MLNLLVLPISFLAVLGFYVFWTRRTVQEGVSSPLETVNARSGDSSLACVQIIDITSTNNSYDPMGDVLSELDLEGVQAILGKPLYADMEGYIQ